MQPLLDRGIIPATRVYALQREAADLSGELGKLIASEAQTKERIAETQLQIIQVDDDQRTEVSDQLLQAESEIGEYSERLIAAEDELRHIDIRSPQAGIVHELAVHAPGAVVTPGEAIMQIVPNNDALTPELRLSPQDIEPSSSWTGCHVAVFRFQPENDAGAKWPPDKDRSRFDRRSADRPELLSPQSFYSRR